MSSDLQIGLSGVLTAQRAMLITAHNISNANTEGYTRQTVNLGTRKPLKTTKGTIGQGVELVKIIRQKDEYINSRIRFITSSLGSASVKSQYLRELETVFNETSDSSINSALSNFFKYVNDLSQNPESTSSRSVLLEKANTLTDTMKRVVNELDEMKTFIKQGLDSKLSEINNLAENVAEINRQIYELSASEIDSNDLLDKRDVLLKDLSKLIDITISNKSNDMVDVVISGGVLVSGTKSMELKSNVDSFGTLKIASHSESTKHSPSGGEVKGLLDIYNNTLVNYEDKLDTLASSLIKEFNSIHSEGVGTSGGFTSIIGTNAVSNTSEVLKSSGAGLPFTPSSGDLWVTVTNSGTGAVTKNKITVDVTTDSLSDLQTSIDGISNISASITDKKLQVQADSGYTFNFSYALDPNPSTASITGTTTPSISGVYNGSSNDEYTFTALGSGTIGTTSGLQVKVEDSSGNTVNTLDVGSDYTAGNSINVANGVSVSFSSGSINAGDSFTLDVINDSDSTNLLAALGINSFFSGTDASDISVNEDISNDVSKIAASIGEVGNNTNALRLAALQDDTSAVEGTTFADYLHQIASALGEEASNAKKTEENYNALDTSLTNRRDEVSGVSVDEELVNLVRYQQAYQASAKYISTINKLVDTLINSFR